MPALLASSVRSPRPLQPTARSARTVARLGAWTGSRARPVRQAITVRKAASTRPTVLREPIGACPGRGRSRIVLPARPGTIVCWPPLRLSAALVARIVQQQEPPREAIVRSVQLPTFARFRPRPLSSARLEATGAPQEACTSPIVQCARAGIFALLGLPSPLIALLGPIGPDLEPPPEATVSPALPVSIAQTRPPPPSLAQRDLSGVRPAPSSSQIARSARKAITARYRPSSPSSALQAPTARPLGPHSSGTVCSASQAPILCKLGGRPTARFATRTSIVEPPPARMCARSIRPLPREATLA